MFFTAISFSVQYECAPVKGIGTKTARHWAGRAVDRFYLACTKVTLIFSSPIAICVDNFE